MTTIYLSSTYEDLKEYREVVYKALRKSGYDVIAMEDYVAADRWPVKKWLTMRAADLIACDDRLQLFERSLYVCP